MLENQVFSQNKDDWLANKSFDFAKDRFNSFYVGIMDNSKEPLDPEKRKKYLEVLSDNNNTDTDWTKIKGTIESTKPGYIETMNELMSENAYFTDTQAIWKTMKEYTKTSYDDKAQSYYQNRQNRVIAGGASAQAFAYSEVDS